MIEHAEGPSERASPRRSPLQAEHTVAAFQAFLACYPGNGTKEWDALREWHSPPYAPISSYYRKLTDICVRVLQRKLVRDELLYQIEAAREYFNQLLEAELGHTATRSSEIE